MAGIKFEGWKTHIFKIISIPIHRISKGKDEGEKEAKFKRFVLTPINYELECFEASFFRHVEHRRRGKLEKPRTRFYF